MPRGNNLFSADIAGKLAKAFKGQLLEGTLNSFKEGDRTVGALTGGRAKSKTMSTFTGFFEDSSVTLMKGTRIEKGDKVVAILGASLPQGVMPSVGDSIKLEGSTYKIVELVNRDPDAALFMYSVRG